MKWSPTLNLWVPIPIFKNCTVAILGGGPSLTQNQVNAVDKYPVIAINDAYKLAPWANILYGCDAKWWKWNEPFFRGTKVGLKWDAVKGVFHSGWNDVERRDVLALASTGVDGLEDAPNGLRTGTNSGYQAINLAVHLGAKRILLLGYDMKSSGGRSHWFGEHPDKVEPPYSTMLMHFPSLVEPLKKRGVEVINCTPDSALNVFKKMDLGKCT